MPLARLMAMAFRSLIDDLHDRLRARGITDVRPAYGFVLLYLRDHDATAREIAELMGTSKQAASKLIGAMEGAKLVRRAPHPTDGRAHRLALTRRGARLLTTVETIYRELEDEWAEVIGAPAVASMRADLLAVLRARNDGELPPVRPGF